MELARKFIWESVNYFLFSINLIIWSSSSKTCQCSKLFGIECLKRNSIFHRSRSGPSQCCKVEVEMDKASTTWFSSQGMASIETILKDFERVCVKSRYFLSFSFLGFCNTCDTMRSESHFTLKYMTPFSIAKLRPRINVSY
jgi:hypothetical protein